MVSTWIFQANPNQFDLDRFLTASPREGLWRTKQHASEVAVGDTVFLWRAIGQKARAHAGIFAEAEITAPPAPQRDNSDFSSYWHDSSDATRIEERAMIRIIRVAKPPGHLMFDDIREDAIVSGLRIFRAPNATNFTTTGDEAARLRRVWDKLGTDWSRGESIDALLAFEGGTPPSALNRTLDRPLSDVRKKLASFESLDPKSRLYSTSTPASELWKEFFDTGAKRLCRATLERARAAL